MEYKKKFNKNKTKVTITAPEGSRGFWNANKRGWEKKKTFIVADKQKIYEKIRKNKRINLKNKYIEGFSLKRFRNKYKSFRNKRVLLKNFDSEGAFFNRGADFSVAVFEGRVFFARANFGDGKVSFAGAIFRGENVAFTDANFGDGAVSFASVTFERGDVDFTGVVFGKGKVVFLGTAFGKGNVAFWNANFGDGNVYFSSATFRKGNVSFWNSIFGKGSVVFRRTNFGGGTIYFGNVNFGEGNIDFRSAIFGNGQVSFTKTNFGEENVDFRDAILGKGKIKFCNLRMRGDWNMNLVQADIIDFSDSIIHGTVNFTGAKIKQLKLINTHLTGKIFVSSQELHLERKLNQEKDVINVQNSSPGEKSDQFRLLKENFHSLGQYEDEDRAYYWFKYHQIRAERELKEGDPFWKKITKPVIFAYKWLAFEKMGKYGTSPRNVMVSMVAVVVLFSLLYLPVVSLKNLGLSNNLSLWIVGVINSIYHSVITFLTIGYGHDFIRQTILGRILSGLEGFAGLFLMAYFTIAFVRKVLR